MSAPTVAVRRALAQAGDKGLAHLAAQQNTGTWISRCGRQVRGQDIRIDAGPAAGAHAEHLGDRFCTDCRTDAIAVAGNIVDGVAVLLSLDPAEDSVAQLFEIPLTAIRVDGASRAPGDDLVESIRSNGVMTPIAARRTPTGLHLVSGTRRLAAAQLAGLETIPTIIHTLDDEHTTINRLLDNLHRQDLDPIAQAIAYQDAVEQLEVSKEALAQGLGISRSAVSNTIRLLELPEHLREHVAAGRMTAAHGRALLRLNGDPASQDELADQILAGDMTTKDAELAARRASAPPAAVPLVDVASLLAGLLDARVKVTSGAERSRFVIEVPNAEANRILGILGAPAVA
jgi:ParB family chromosome partitioning protein